jgi:hypothetical protein
MPIENLIDLRERYGATHYLAKGRRRDLAAHLLHHDGGYSVYDLRGLRPAGSEKAPASTGEGVTAKPVR